MVSYEGEALRLVGTFNSWSLSEPDLSLSVLEAEEDCTGVASPHFLPEDAFLPSIRAPDVAPEAIRHRFVGKLVNGSFAFQVVSVTQGFAFRIFPWETYVHQPLRLVCGEPSAVPALVGGTEDGVGLEFHISEDPGSVVSIYVELLNGGAVSSGPGTGKRGAGGTRRGVAVWYVLDNDSVRIKAAAPLSSDSNEMSENAEKETRAGNKNRPFTSSNGLPPVDVIPDTRTLRPELASQLSRQAVVVSKRTFRDNAMSVDLSSHKRLALLTGTSRESVLGYCLFSLADPSCMDIEQLAVSEEHRGKQLGRLLLNEVLKFAVSFGCQTAELWSTVDARSFYERLGFKEEPDAIPMPEMVRFWGPLDRMRISVWSFARDIALKREIWRPNGVAGIAVGTQSAVMRNVTVNENNTTCAELARFVFHALTDPNYGEKFYQCVPGTHKILQDFGERGRIYTMEMSLPRDDRVRWTMFTGMHEDERDGSSMLITARVENEGAEAAGYGCSSPQLYTYWCIVHEPVVGKPGMVKSTQWGQAKFFKYQDRDMRLVTEEKANIQFMLFHSRAIELGLSEVTKLGQSRADDSQHLRRHASGGHH